MPAVRSPGRPAKRANCANAAADQRGARRSAATVISHAAFVVAGRVARILAATSGPARAAAVARAVDAPALEPVGAFLPAAAARRRVAAEIALPGEAAVALIALKAAPFHVAARSALDIQQPRRAGLPMLRCRCRLSSTVPRERKSHPGAKEDGNANQTPDCQHKSPARALSARVETGFASESATKQELRTRSLTPISLNAL